MKEQPNNGMGVYQRREANKARQLLYAAMEDGEWHRCIELKKITKLSSRTLAKHIEELVKLKLMERKEDRESGEYPIPVFYKLDSTFINDFIKQNSMRKVFSDNIGEMIDETKDPLMIYDMVNAFCQVFFIQILKEIQNNKKIDNEELEYLEEMFLWYNFRYFTSALISASFKIIDKIDVNQLLLEQVIRQKEISELAIKRYAELGITKVSLQPDKVKDRE
jgi:hypothetical protein